MTTPATKTRRRTPPKGGSGTAPPRRDVLAFTVPVDIRAAEAGQTGPRTFELVAYTGEPMRICYWDDPVVIDCSTLRLDTQSIPALYDHWASIASIVGQVQEIAVANGLPPITAKGIFTPTDAEHDIAVEVLAKADAGFKWQASIGGTPASVERYKAGETVTVNGREYVGPVAVARGVTLREISFVVLGGDRHTSAVVARLNQLQGGGTMDFETWVTSLGFTVADLTDQQRAALQIQFNQIHGDDTEAETETETPPTNAEAETPPATETETETPPANAGARPVPIQAGQTVEAERQRIAAIQSAAQKYGHPTMLVGGKPVAVAAHAIAEGWDATRAEIQAMRSQLRTPPSNVVSRSGTATVQALQGAMLLRAGGVLDHKGYGSLHAVELLKGTPWLRASLNDATRNRIMDEAHRLSKLSAPDVCAAALRAHGRDVPHDRDDMIQAAFSSGSLRNVMTTSVNAILLQTYMDTPDTTVGWCREQDVADYKLNERPRVEKGGELTEQPENAEAEHDTMTDTVETYKIKRMSRQFAVDEIAVVNDSLGAIGEKPREFGGAARRLRPNLVYATLLENPTLSSTGRALFNATDGNANTSAALASGTLSAGLAEMATIRENGVNIDVTPSHLLVPFALRDTAVQLCQSPTLVVGGTAGTVTQVGTRNPLNDWGLIPVPEKRLDNGVTHPITKQAYSGSSTTWFLVSNMVPPFEIGYLRGTGRAPKVRSWNYDREGRFGIGWDVVLPIGICPLDWRGAQRNIG